MEKVRSSRMCARRWSARPRPALSAVVVIWKLNLQFRVQEILPDADHWLQAKAEHERAERLAEELRRRRGNREDVRAQLEREAEAGVKLQLQQRDLEWRQKYQVRHLCR